MSEGNCPEHLWPLRPVSREDGQLWKSLIADPKLVTYSVYGLFPAAYDLVYGDATALPEIRYSGRTRGRVAIITGTREHRSVGVVIKPWQSPAEPDIASVAGAIGVGPVQLPSIAGFISEEFVAGAFLTDLPAGELSADLMRSVGQQVGAAITKLHNAGVCYNDATFSDPEGRSHVIVEPHGGIKLIDFGVSLMLQDHPAGLTFHDAYNAARTDPMFHLFRRMTPVGDSDSLARFVADYGRRLAAQSREEIQQRDWRIAEEGLAIIARRFAQEMAEALSDGLKAAR